MVPLPEEFAARFGSEAELGRHVLEVLAVEEYRAGRMGKFELRQLLGFGTRGELDGFLKERGVDDGMTMDEFEQDLQDMERAGL